MFYAKDAISISAKFWDNEDASIVSMVDEINENFERVDQILELSSEKLGQGDTYPYHRADHQPHKD